MYLAAQTCFFCHLFLCDFMPCNYKESLYNTLSKSRHAEKRLKQIFNAGFTLQNTVALLGWFFSPFKAQLSLSRASSTNCCRERESPCQSGLGFPWHCWYSCAQLMCISSHLSQTVDSLSSLAPASSATCQSHLLLGLSLEKNHQLT